VRRISIILGGRIIARGSVAELHALAGTDDPQLTPVFLKLTGGRACRRSRCDPRLPLAPPPRALERAEPRP